MSNWKDISDFDSAFVTFGKTTSFTKTLLLEAEEGEEPKEVEVTTDYSLQLEERNKNWSHPYNWRLTVTQLNQEEPIHVEEYYAYVGTSLDDIKKMAIERFEAFAV